jgi:nitrite reductase/ring-hydroxylating ferredoxin subunit
MRGARRVPTRDGDVAIFRTGDGQVFALADRCPHKGGPLSQGIVHGHAVACPLHNWSIELATGEPLGADAARAARRSCRCGRGRAAAAGRATVTKTACPYCGVGCGVVRRRRAAR